MGVVAVAATATTMTGVAAKERDLRERSRKVGRSWKKGWDFISNYSVHKKSIGSTSLPVRLAV